MTTSRAADESPSTSPPSSSDLEIDIHVFHCGHGDTILIRLPGERWGLIDCYLPEQFGIRKAFLDFIDKNRIKRLDFIIQTHPDRDHYHGMKAVIEYFLGKGEKVKYYIDTGLTARRARDLLLNRPARAEYEILQNSLEEWDRTGQIGLRTLQARYKSFIPEGFVGRIQFVPIGPDPDHMRRLSSSDLRRLASRPVARPVANEISLVVVLMVHVDGRGFGVLLGADAGTETIEWALDYWTQHAGEIGLAPEFDVIKVPHHGSIGSHTPRLCRMKRTGSGPSLAAISAGTRSCLPDREVLLGYLNEGWDVMATTTGGKKPRHSLPMMLADRGTPEEDDVGRFSLHVSWSPSTGLRAEPAAARIGPDDLIYYETSGG